jgi:hypothetical protein
VLNATIDPNGLETTYEFWIEFADCQDTPPGDAQCESISLQKVGEGHIPAGAIPETVVASYSHLWPEYEYGYWVVAKNASGETRSSGSHKFTALPAPVVDSESVSGVGEPNAALDAQIDPKGQAVYYQFQLVENPSEFASELECNGVEFFCKESGTPPRVLKIGYLPAGNGATAVALDLAQAGVTLTPGVTYHYRVLVAPAVRTEDTIEWDGPPVYGVDQTFTVQGPSIEEVSAPSVSATDATLQGRIDTEGLPTLYQFELRINLCPHSECVGYKDIPLPSGLLTPSSSPQTVNIDLNDAGVSLNPAYYEYALSATSAAGHAETEWHPLIPPMLDPSAPVQPLKGTTQIGGGSQTGSGSGTPNSSPSGPQSSSPTSGPGAPKTSIPAGRPAGKGRIKIKRSIKHSKRKHGKSSSAKHTHRKARHR